VHRTWLQRPGCGDWGDNGLRVQNLGETGGKRLLRLVVQLDECLIAACFKVSRRKFQVFSPCKYTRGGFVNSNYLTIPHSLHKL
jgi:hypothetical protein